ncbi:hypothetical protein J3F83DRAFT_558850 [Trichoderma novae-zelandiae]
MYCPPHCLSASLLESSVDKQTDLANEAAPARPFPHLHPHLHPQPCPALQSCHGPPTASPAVGCPLVRSSARTPQSRSRGFAAALLVAWERGTALLEQSWRVEARSCVQSWPRGWKARCLALKLIPAANRLCLGRCTLIRGPDRQIVDAYVCTCMPNIQLHWHLAFICCSLLAHCWGTHGVALVVQEQVGSSRPRWSVRPQAPSSSSLHIHRPRQQRQLEIAHCTWQLACRQSLGMGSGRRRKTCQRKVAAIAVPCSVTLTSTLASST